MNPADAAAQAALRERLGAGARYDAETAPKEDLLLARRGAAYFARKLNELADDELSAPSLEPGLSRAQIVAAVSYSARAMCVALAAARQSRAVDLLQTRATDEERDKGGTLPPHALRSLYQHTDVHLNVEWRDLTDAEWNVVVSDRFGSSIAVRDTALERARQIWRAAVLLGNGGAAADVPERAR